MIRGWIHAMRDVRGTRTRTFRPRFLLPAAASAAAGLLLLFLFASAGAMASDAADESPELKTSPDFKTVEIRGKIVWLDEALRRRFGIKTVAEARQQAVAIETDQGDLVPVAADTRGYSFQIDPRLRVDGSFVVRRYQGAPLVQVIRIFDITEQGKFELDYWCEICAIAMYQLKPCDCCQGPIELRRRPVKNDPLVPAPER